MTEELDLSAFPPHVYAVLAQIGPCRICNTQSDLRCGVCFCCSHLVSGKAIPGGHEFWETLRPSNRWVYMDKGN